LSIWLFSDYLLFGCWFFACSEVKIETSSPKSLIYAMAVFYKHGIVSSIS
jgi:hypothetical protein